MGKASKSAVKSAATAAKSAAKPIARTEVRNSPVPRAAAVAPKAAATVASALPAKKSPSHDLIARRAYEIWSSGQGGSEFDNWVRAERELRGV